MPPVTMATLPCRRCAVPAMSMTCFIPLSISATSCLCSLFLLWWSTKALRFPFLHSPRTTFTTIDMPLMCMCRGLCTILLIIMCLSACCHTATCQLMWHGTCKTDAAEHVSRKRNHRGLAGTCNPRRQRCWSCCGACKVCNTRSRDPGSGHPLSPAQNPQFMLLPGQIPSSIPQAHMSLPTLTQQGHLNSLKQAHLWPEGAVRQSEGFLSFPLPLGKFKVICRLLFVLAPRCSEVS